MLRVNVNLDYFSSNLKNVRNFVKNDNAKVIPIVKANGYGLGQEAVVETLVKNNADELFTFSLADAIRLRLFVDERFVGKKVDVFVVMGISRGEEELYYKYNLVPTINNEEQFNLWKNFSTLKNEKMECVVQFNTGMNRSGFDYSEAENIKKMFDEKKDKLSIRYVISHLCCADNQSSFMNERQRMNFTFIKQYFTEEKFCLTASEGMMLGKEYFFDAVRPFHALIRPIDYKNNTLKIKQVMSILANVVDINDNVATVDIGEKNNYRKELLANKELSVLIGGKRFKVLDIEEETTKVMVDDSVNIGDEVVITSNDLFLAELTENGVKIATGELHLLLGLANTNIINYIGNNGKKYISYLNDDMIIADNFRKINIAENKRQTFVSEKRIIEGEDEYVGYSIKYKAKKHDVLLVLPIGYFDDLVKYKIFEGNVKFSCNGIECQNAGNPSMNQIILKIAYEDRDRINVGDMVEVSF